MKIKVFSLLLILSIGVSAAAQAPLKVKASAGLALIGKLIALKADFESATGAQLEILNTAGVMVPSNLILIDRKEIDVAIVSGNWDAMVRLTQKKGYKFAQLSEFKTVKIGEDKVLLISRSDLFKTLSKTDVEKIFSGEVMNWRELGGPDRAIEIALPEKSQASVNLFVENLLGERALRPRIKYLPSYADVRNFVTQNPGAVGLANNDNNLGNLKIHPAVTAEKTTYFVTLGEPTPAAKKLLEYVLTKRTF